MTTAGGLHPSAQRVADALRAADVHGEVREFTAPTRTAQEAATALGCELAAIASCLVLLADDEPIVVIKSGRIGSTSSTSPASSVPVGSARRTPPRSAR